MIMKNCLLLLIATVTALAGCIRHSEEWQTILNVENYIEDRPDSALTVLGSIDTEQLSWPEERAKHAVLLSMALDKNYVNKTDFDVLQPAIDWYENHGSPTDRLRTSYYQGRIYLHCRDNENAMKCFVKALNSGEKSDDILTKARALFQQGEIYNDLYNWDKAIEARLQAAEYFKKADRQNSYLNCMLSVSHYCYLKGDKANSEFYANVCEENLADANISNKNNYYFIRIINLPDTVSRETMTNLINEYIASIPDEKINWLAIAKAYLKIGDIEHAVEYIKKKDISGYPDLKAQYYATKSLIYRETEMYKEALDAYMSYVAISDSLDMVIFRQDTKFVEERYQLKFEAAEEHFHKNLAIIIIIVIIVFSSGIIMLNRNRLKISRMEKQMADSEAERYRMQYLQMEEERDNLNALIEKKENIDHKVMAAISSRLELLNKFFTAHITDNYEIDRKASKELAELLSDKDKFMELTRFAFAGSKPSFISYLEECGLTEQEINYCCLYAIGLKGKEVGAYIKMRSHYNISSVIREKLGIGEHDTNLGIYIRKLVNGQSKAERQPKNID